MSCLLSGFVRPSSALDRKIGKESTKRKREAIPGQAHKRKGGKRTTSDVKSVSQGSTALGSVKPKSHDSSLGTTSSVTRTSTRLSRSSSLPSKISKGKEAELKMRDMRFLLDVHFAKPTSLGVCVEKPMNFPRKLQQQCSGVRLLAVDRQLERLKKAIANPTVSKEDIIRASTYQQEAPFTSENRAHFRYDPGSTAMDEVWKSMKELRPWQDTCVCRKTLPRMETAIRTWPFKCHDHLLSKSIFATTI